MLTALEAAYKDIHSHPELSMHETRTSAIAADWLESLGFGVTRNVGGTGVVGLLKNGPGPTVMLRADMDALPVSEKTGLGYASRETFAAEGGTEVPVMHACGHDMHVSWLMGAARLFAESLDNWSGTVMAVFQPAEETGSGAMAMLNDGFGERFPKPDVILGQHVMVGRSGLVSWKSGTVTSISDSYEIRMFGRGAHGSMPQSSIDPVIMASSTAIRLQAVVSREVSPLDFAVLTIGSLQAGNKANVISDEAVLRVNIRTFREEVRSRVTDAMERIVNAEALASGSPTKPQITGVEHYSSVVNDPGATATVVESFRGILGDDAIQEGEATSASEDFGRFGDELGVPSVFWFVGGTDPEVMEEAEKSGKVHEIPTNHNPGFAPVIHPTLETGITALMAAAGAWLCH